MEYHYVEGCESSTQYDNYVIGKPVQARYIHARIEEDAGNPFIEALPLPRTEEEMSVQYHTALPSYSYDKVRTMTKLDKMLGVGTLKTIRYPLPFHKQLEFEFYNSLVTSYRARKTVFSKYDSITYFYENEIKNSCGIMIGDSATPTNAGFSLVGYSGCGKSSAIETLVAHYPQVIMHEFGDYGTFPQITYIVVNCIPNSNFSALYTGIGDAIDKALGNIEPVYADEISKSGNLGAKAEKVMRLIERFAIGIIIFDEIQLINFEHTKENTFDSLLTLANRTKTAIAVVGTEDAKEKMFGELRTARRVGKIINGNNYCDNRKFFDYLAKNLFRYQWFDTPVEYTQEIGDTLYDLTKGIVDQLICVYSAVQLEYLQKNKAPEINGDFFRKVANKYYNNIQEVLANLESTENVAKLNGIRLSAANKMKLVVDMERQREETEKIIDNNINQTQNEIQLFNIASSIRNIYDYTDTQIQNAYKKVISKKTNEGKDEREITREVIRQLEAEPHKKQVKKVKGKLQTTNDMRSFLGVDAKGE